MKKHALKGLGIVSIGTVLMVLLSVSSTPVLQAQGPPDLEALHQRLLPLFENNAVVYTDADEGSGRLVVGVLNRGIETAIRARLNALGVSSASVDVVETNPIVQLATLQDYVRPIVGGVQIRFDSWLCTLGFNGVNSTGIEGFVVNSHCTGRQGGVDGTQYYQPLEQESVYFIGTEIADPAYVRGGGCPRGRVCRKSDSAFVQRASGVAAGQGFIAKTTAVGSITLDGNQFRITGKGPSALGQTVNKIGRTTGWTSGRVSGTCANTGVAGTNIVQLCQDFVDAASGGGDSGSPVFAIVNGNDVQLRGILWGGGTKKNGTQYYVYSPIANIEQELGSIAVVP